MAGNVLKINLQHVRSFANAQQIPIRPLTLLVGENSSGKSTFLAIASALFGMGFPGRPDFNEPPFALGTFETIATYKGGKYGRDDNFMIGFEDGTDFSGPRRVTATFARAQGRPGLIRFRGENSRGFINLSLQDESISGDIAWKDAHEAKVITHSFKLPDPPLPREFGSTESFIGSIGSALMSGKKPMPLETYRAFRSLARALRSPFNQTVPFAPIRTRPKRTYDELSEDYSPEGDHVPKVLARLLNEERQTDQARGVKEAVVQFGEGSGLFREVEVKKLGKGPDDPFQVQIGVGGPRVNLMDVGYGVSQALPLIVQSVLRRENSLMLIQQPEVHLHPRAQAALGTFFAGLVADGKDTLLIETHSDSLIDRVRYEVAHGTIDSKNVLILFFYKPNIETTVYPINIDPLGNIEGAPEHYRDFFLKEELRLLAPQVNDVLNR